jgi:hypothetical protein
MIPIPSSTINLAKMKKDLASLSSDILYMRDCSYGT